LNTKSMRPFEVGQDGLMKSALEDPVILSGAFWEELRIFLAVAKLGSFAKAGAYLGQSTPTIGRHVKRLQDQLRAQLIVSGRTGSKLTTDGCSLATALSELDHKVFSIASNFRTTNREAEGVVRISVTEGLAGVFVASSMAKFNELWPGITVHLKTPINVASLRENRADIMIAFTPETASDITTLPLGFLHFVPIASQSYLSRKGVPKREDVSRHIFVDSHFYAAKTGMWESWQGLISRGHVAAYCDSSLSYGMSVIGGLGIGLLGNYTLSDPTLKALDLGIHVRVPIFLVALAERIKARPVRIVADWLTETFGPANPWFEADLNLRSFPETQFVETMHALRGETLSPPQ
jgi:DNA-binding transcriptional LysR family regulator